MVRIPEIKHSVSKFNRRTLTNLTWSGFQTQYKIRSFPRMLKITISCNVLKKKQTKNKQTKGKRATIHSLVRMWILTFVLCLTLTMRSATEDDKVIPPECAIKVFKTTLNEFKNRDKYIKDDYRFKDRFSKLNPRKIIRMWAEKEMHNLTR